MVPCVSRHPLCGGSRLDRRKALLRLRFRAGTRGPGRSAPGSFAFNLWLARIGSAAFVVAIAAAVAILIAIASVVYSKLSEGEQET
jgi:hypothetical protein